MKITVEQIKQLKDLGVARVGIPPPALDRARVERGLHEFAERIMARA